jgi:large subunit ribosomal protein L6
MSKIGKLPIKLPEGVSLEVKGSEIYISGPKGTLSRIVPGSIKIQTKDDYILLTSNDVTKSGKAKFGTNRMLIANMVKGVTQGWEKELELVGTGYRAEVVDGNLSLLVGYSHPIKVEVKEGITFKVEKTIITVSGLDKELVGQVAANIRAIRPPEPYKGKGIKYRNEIIRRKAGKAAKAAGAPA